MDCYCRVQRHVGPGTLMGTAKPFGWQIYQSITLVNAETFGVQWANMKSIMAEMVKNVDMVIFNRCSSGMDLGSYRRSMKALNSYVQIVFEDKKRRYDVHCRAASV